MEKDKWAGETESFLKQRLSEGSYLSSHRDALAYRLEHSYRVADIGRQIARKEGFDETEMTVACLLHDIAYCEDFGENGWKDHGRRSAAIARPFLAGLGIPGDRIDDICYGIAMHVDGEADRDGEPTPFALTVGDADNIDRFGAYRIHETLCLDRFLRKSLRGKREYVSARLSRLENLMDMQMGTAAAKEMWTERIRYYMEFLRKLGDQLDRSGPVTGHS